MIDHSSLTSTTISLFRASLLFVALLSTFCAHFIFYPPVFSVLVVSSFLFLNTMFACKKMSSLARVTQAKKLPENKVVMPMDHQNGDEKVLDTINDVFDQLEEKSDEKIEFGVTTSLLSSSSSRNLSSESISEDIEEDYLIEIPLVKREPDSKENDRQVLETGLIDLAPRPVLQQEGLQDFLSDANEIGGEDNLIEIDISIGSIRHSGPGSGPWL